MSDNTKISWTDATWNPIVGCSRVSPGCANCYAVPTTNRGMAEQHRGVTKKLGNGKLDWTGKINLVPNRLFVPSRWTRPRRIFVNSLSDPWHEGVTREFLAAMFGVMIAAGQHTFQLLTKRPERAAAWYRWVAEQPGGPAAYCLAQARLVADEVGEGRFATHHAKGAPLHWPPRNIELGVTAEDQERADERIPILLLLPAAVRWVSAEPLLGPIDFGALGDDSWLAGVSKLDWIVVGGESGHGARSYDVAWARSIIAQCAEAGVPVWHKQVGAEPHDSATGYPGGLAHPWPPGTKTLATYPVRLALRDSKGGDMDEWPEDLRVQQLPGSL